MRDDAVFGVWLSLAWRGGRDAKHALREAFPADFAGLYDSAEMGVEPARLPEQPVAQPEPAEVEVLEPEPAQDANRPAEPATQPETGMAEADIEF